MTSAAGLQRTALAAQAVPQQDVSAFDWDLPWGRTDADALRLALDLAARTGKRQLTTVPELVDIILDHGLDMRALEYRSQESAAAVPIRERPLITHTEISVGPGTAGEPVVAIMHGGGILATPDRLSRGAIESNRSLPPPGTELERVWYASLGQLPLDRSSFAELLAEQPEGRSGQQAHLHLEERVRHARTMGLVPGSAPYSPEEFSEFLAGSKHVHDLTRGDDLPARTRGKYVVLLPVAEVQGTYSGHLTADEFFGTHKPNMLSRALIGPRSAEYFEASYDRAQRCFPHERTVLLTHPFRSTYFDPFRADQPQGRLVRYDACDGLRGDGSVGGAGSFLIGPPTMRIDPAR